MTSEQKHKAGLKAGVTIMAVTYIVVVVWFVTILVNHNC